MIAIESWIDSNPPTGIFTYSEFYKMVRAYRDRYCRNELAAPVDMNHLQFFGDKRVIYLSDKVELVDGVVINDK